MGGVVVVLNRNACVYIDASFRVSFLANAYWKEKLPTNNKVRRVDMYPWYVVDLVAK